MLTFVLGIAIGQGLAFSGAVSPADFHVRAQRAWQGHDYREALQFWNHAVALQPADPNVHYLRGTALARLGLRLSALDAFQMALLLDPSPALARRVQADIAELNQAGGSAGARETTVPLEHSLGVWTAQVVLNDSRAGRFLVDTGSSVTVVSPKLAVEAGVRPTADGAQVELQTLGGRTTGPSAVVASLRVCDLEIRDALVVVHDPGSAFDGILGNTFLGRYRVTLDADRRQLQLRLLAGD